MFLDTLDSQFDKTEVTKLAVAVNFMLMIEKKRSRKYAERGNGLKIATGCYSCGE